VSVCQKCFFCNAFPPYHPNEVPILNVAIQVALDQADDKPTKNPTTKAFFRVFVRSTIYGMTAFFSLP
jgi:hypothetical protein